MNKLFKRMGLQNAPPDGDWIPVTVNIRSFADRLNAELGRFSAIAAFCGLIAETILHNVRAGRR
ncbi:hypothetical protein KCP73_07750 [Salmonella enterica subsp. enterica]|nr:hypothetical protein KCP73_07750 [Salmonella enterica subsp. enterica]